MSPNDHAPAEQLAKQQLAKFPNVHLLPATADLQAPSYFCDTTHLNRAGRKLWTGRLAEFIRGLAD